MLTKVFLLFVVLVAIAVQAAPTNHFISPEQAKNIESNDLKTYLQAAGSGGTAVDTGVDVYTVKKIGAGQVQIDFDASGLTYYYFMVKDAANGPATVPSPTGVRNFEDIHIGEAFVNSGDADGPISVVIDVVDSDVISIYVAAVYDSTLYPTDNTFAQVVAENYAIEPSVDISASYQFDAAGTFNLDITTNSAGTYQVFTYQCCDLAIRGHPMCPKDVNLPVVCSAGSTLGYTPIGENVAVSAGTSSYVGVADPAVNDLPYTGYVSINVWFTQAATGEVFMYQAVATGVDDIAPIWLSAPAVASVDGSSITLSADVDDQVTFYTLATNVTDAVPTSAEIIAAGNTGTTVSGLADNTEYIVYVVPVSSMSGEGLVESVSAFTADETAPVVLVCDAGTVTRTTISIFVQCDEVCFQDGLLTTGSAATYTEVIASNETVPMVNVATDGSIEYFLEGLEPSTTYFLTVVTYDAFNNTEPVTQVVEFTTQADIVYNTAVFSMTNDVAVNGAISLASEPTLEVTATTGVLVQTPIAVSTIGAEIATVTFVGGVEGDVFTLSLVTTAWTEFGATAECAALLADKCINAVWDINNNDVSTSTSVTATVIDGKLVFDVTADVAAMIAGGDNFGWYLSGDSAGSFGSSDGVNGPELTLSYQSDVVVGQNAFGPICQAALATPNFLNLSCATGVININSASWGRHNTIQCQFPRPTKKSVTSNTECHSETTICVVSETCNGLTECSVEASIANFGDPCTQTWKYLEGTYSCLTNVGDFCSGFVAGNGQSSCVSSDGGPVYSCEEGYTGDACEIAPVITCDPLVLHLSFDAETPEDVSCNDNVVVDYNEPEYTAGVSGQAAKYGEVDGQYAHVSDAEILQLSAEFSACLWVNADSEEGVKNGHTSVVLSQGVMGGAGAAGRQGFGIYLNKDNKYQTGARVAVRFERAQGRQTLEQPFTIDGNWHFVCATFSEAKQALYVDGTVVTEDRFASHGPVTPSTEGIFVGTDFESSKYQSYGAIDEVKIYNVALSADEVSQVFTADGGIIASTGFFEAADTKANEDDIDHVVLNVAAAGCSDGTREGFHAQDGIAACAGAWSVPGVHTADSFNRQCEGVSGQGCSVADVCSVGWHVCVNAAEVMAKSDGLGCNGVSDFSDGFFVSRQSGNGNINMVSEGTNDVFGCGQGASIGKDNEARGLNAFTHNKCSRVDGSWSCKGDGEGLDEALTITHDSDFGGAMCCRDDRDNNGGQQKSGHKQVHVKVKKSTGKSHHDDEECKAIGQAIETEVCKKSKKSCKIRAVRKFSGSSNKSKKSKQSHGGNRRLLQTTADPQYTYVVYEVVPGATSDGQELADIQAVIYSSDSDLNTDFVGIEGYSELHSCEDGTMQSSCDGVVLAETTPLPAGSVGNGYGEAETSILGNSSDIVNAVIVTASVFVLLIVSGFAYRAHTAKSVDQEFDAKIMNSTQQASDVEMSGAKGKEQDTYWVFNKQTEGQDVRVVV